MAPRRTLGLIAGLGQLPGEIARAARDRGSRVVGLGLEGLSEPGLERLVDEWHEVELGGLGSLMDLLEQSRVSDVVLAGSVGKRAFFDAQGGLRLDERATGVLQRLKDHDDDAILGAVVSEIEAQGVRVCSQGEWVPHLLPPAGFLGTHRPSREQYRDIDFGLSVARALGRLGAGQCAIVRSGCVLALEAVEGTDAAIRRAGQFGGGGAVVVKVVRPGQDRRFDLPAIGRDTLAAMAEAQASVLAFQAGATLVLDPEDTAMEADRLGIVVVGVEVPTVGRGEPR